MADEDSGSLPPAHAFHRIDDELQARMLVDEKILRYFQPFLCRERTVSDAAREAGCKPSAMLYRVGTFVDAGLLRVVREKKRAGRAQKIYRSTHDAYFVPYRRTPFSSVEEGFYEGFEANARRLARLTARRYRGRGWDGYRFYRASNGTPWVEGAPDADRVVDLADPDRPVGLDFMIDLRLTTAEAEAVQAQLADVLRRHRSREERQQGDRPFVLSVAFVPDDPEDAT